MNKIEVYKPFIIEHQGLEVMVRTVSVNFREEAGGFPELILTCAIDNQGSTTYNNHKEEQMYCDSIINSNDFFINPSKEYKTKSITFETNNKEEKMSLAQQYLHEKKNENDKSAIEVGAMNDDGTLTYEGKDLLLNILLTDPKIREQFDKAIELLKEDEEE